jgi:hypothetical protein
MRTIKTYRKVGAFYIAWEEDFSTSIQLSAGTNRGLPASAHNPLTRVILFGSRINGIAARLRFHGR